jgi:hypothetical protein
MTSSTTCYASANGFRADPSNSRVYRVRRILDGISVDSGTSLTDNFSDIADVASRCQCFDGNSFGLFHDRKINGRSQLTRLKVTKNGEQRFRCMTMKGA